MITSHMAADSHGLTGSAFQGICRCRRYRARGDRCTAYKNAEEQGSTREHVRAALFRNCSPSRASPATSRPARPERPAPAQCAAPARRHWLGCCRDPIRTPRLSACWLVRKFWPTRRAPIAVRRKAVARILPGSCLSLRGSSAGGTGRVVGCEYALARTVRIGGGCGEGAAEQTISAPTRTG